jgi:hypothetical protein
LRCSSATAAPSAPLGVVVVPTKAGPVSVRVVVVGAVVLVAVGVVVLVVDEVTVVLVVEDVVVEELVVVLDDVAAGASVCVWVTVTVSVVFEPQAASSAAAASAAVRTAGFSGIFGTRSERFQFAIQRPSGYRQRGRERERWPVEQRRTPTALLYTSSQVLR